MSPFQIHEYAARSHQRGFGGNGDGLGSGYIRLTMRATDQPGPVRVLVENHKPLTPEGARLLAESSRTNKPGYLRTLLISHDPKKIAPVLVKQ